MRNLLLWVHPGFSVFAGLPIEGNALTLLFAELSFEHTVFSEQVFDGSLLMAIDQTGEDQEQQLPGLQQDFPPAVR